MNRFRWAVILLLTIPWLLAAAVKISKFQEIECNGIETKMLQVEKMKADIIQVRTMLLVDENQKNWGAFTATPEGGFFMLSDGKGKPRIMIQVQEKAGKEPSVSIRLADEAGKESGLTPK